MRNTKPLVSVTIPTFNSAKTLEKTLQSLHKQTYKNIEIIVADGFSKDETMKIAKKYKAKVCYGKELARARHEALKKAKGIYIFQLDSDQFINKGVLARCVTQCEESNLNALVLNEKSLVRKNAFIERLLSYDKSIVSGSLDIDPRFGAVIPRFFRTKVLRKIYWPQNLSILDDAIVFQKNKKILQHVGFLKGDGIRHYEVDDFGVFFRKFRRYGRLYLSTLFTSPDTTLAHSLPRRAYFSQKMLKRPDMLAGVALLYILKASAVVTGIFEELVSLSLRPLKRFV